MHWKTVAVLAACMVAVAVVASMWGLAAGVAFAVAKIAVLEVTGMWTRIGAKRMRHERD